MRPALHRIGLIAIQDDIVGHIVKIDPFLVGRLERMVAVDFRQMFALVQRALDTGFLPPQASLIIGPDEGKGEQQERSHEKDLAAVSRHKPACPVQISTELAHS